MLVLSRQRDEKVVLTLQPLYAGMPLIRIEVSVVDIRGDKVRLGFNAPEEVTIHREEVQKAIEADEQRQPPS